MTNLKLIKKVVNRKKVSTALLVAFTFNIFAPVLTYAAPASLSAVETQTNVTPQAQVNKIVLPRDVVPGDTLTITISGSTINQAFLTDNLDTSNAFSALIDALSEVTSSYDDPSKTFTIGSQIPGVPFTISDLVITRGTINPNTTVANVVAIAQVSELSIPQQLFAGDSLNFTVGGVGIITAFSLQYRFFIKCKKLYKLCYLCVQIFSSTIKKITGIYLKKGIMSKPPQKGKQHIGNSKFYFINKLD